MNRVDLTNNSAWFDLDSCVRFSDKRAGSVDRESLYCTYNGNWIRHTWTADKFDNVFHEYPRDLAITWLINHDYKTEAACYLEYKREL